MPRRTDTRQRVLRTAADLFRAKGYHATGLNQVLAEGGAPKGSLYFHFPGGKEQLATEALELTGGEMCAAIGTALASTDSPADAIDAVVGHLADALVASGYTAGCPVATVALDAAGESETIRSACDRAYRSWIDVAAEHLAAQGIPADRADGLGTFVVASLEGALLLARTRRDLAPLREVGTRLRKSIMDELEDVE